MTLWAGFAKKHRELMFASPQELVRIPTRAGRLGGSSLEQRLWAGHVLRGPKAPQLASTQPGSALRRAGRWGTETTSAASGKAAGSLYPNEWRAAKKGQLQANLLWGWMPKS